jgi:hypothetical protein
MVASGARVVGAVATIVAVDPVESGGGVVHAPSSIAAATRRAPLEPDDVGLIAARP